VAKEKDWTGDANSVFRMIGRTHDTKYVRDENDYYATDPRAAEMLLELEKFDQNIYEPACGEGYLSKVFEKAGHTVLSTDLIDRGFGFGGIDFLQNASKFNGDIITNPPFKYAQQFIEKALDIIPEGNKVAMFLKVQFMEGKARKKLFTQFPPKTIWVSSSRINCAINGNFEMFRTSGGSPICYAWYIWEKGFKGNTSLKWFN